ncbi:MAG: acetyl-CoA C-acetyltransferase [Gammaproteobacteria bacterium]
MNTQPVYIVGGVRTPFVKSMTHYSNITTQALMTATLKTLVRRYDLVGKQVGDVGLGAVMKSSSNWNLSRECVLDSGLDPHTPGYDVQRACGTSLETTLQIARKIAEGQISCGIAGGVDSNSDLPLMLSRSLTQKLLKMRAAKSTSERMQVIFSLRPRDFKPVMPAIVEPHTGLSMGQHCEKMVQEWQITRASQDALALQSHMNAIAAYEQGFYEDLVFAYQNLDADTIPRKNTTLDKLAKLKPAFDFTDKGTLTAGNSSPLTDGSSAVLLANEAEMQQRGWAPLARFVDAEVAAVDFVQGEGLLMAPTIAVSRLLQRNNLTLQDFDFYEIHEAFAGQVLCSLKAWQTPEYCKNVLKRDEPLGSIDLDKLNIKGGSVALGHPFAATGTRIVASLAKMLFRRGQGRGLISICTAGGMGVVAILEAI